MGGREGKKFWNQLVEGFGHIWAFPKGRGRVKGRKVTLKSTSHVPGSEDTKAVWWGITYSFG